MKNDSNDHSKSPESEEESIQEGMAKSFEAPTDESWENNYFRTFAEKFKYSQEPLYEDIKSFIASLLKRNERDIMKRYGIKEDGE